MDAQLQKLRIIEQHDRDTMPIRQIAARLLEARAVHADRLDAAHAANNSEQAARALCDELSAVLNARMRAAGFQDYDGLGMGAYAILPGINGVGVFALRGE